MKILVGAKKSNLLINTHFVEVNNDLSMWIFALGVECCDSMIIIICSEMSKTFPNNHTSYHINLFNFFSTKIILVNGKYQQKV